MPLWAYQMSSLYLVLLMVASIEFVSMVGLFLARRLLIPHLRFHDGVNESVSGTVQAIGVFYGITVGLIAVGVWNTNSSASDLVSKEATSIGALYRDVSGYPQPLRDLLRSDLRTYTIFVIDVAWPAQKIGRGQKLDIGSRILDNFQTRLYTFEPTTPGQASLHNETLKAYNTLIEYRRLRIDAVDSGLSSVMWAVIWLGAAMSIGVAYFYKVPDPKLHGILVALMGGFLAIVLFMITMNVKPFSRYVSV